MSAAIIPMVDLDRRIARRMEQGAGIRLSANDLDMLLSCGAFEAIHTAAQAALRDMLEWRKAQKVKASISEGTSGSTGRLVANTFSSSGMTQEQEGQSALQRLKRMRAAAN